MATFACVMLLKPCPYVACLACVAFAGFRDAFQDVRVVHRFDVRNKKSSAAQGYGGHHPSLLLYVKSVFQVRLACQTKPWRSLVEAGGVE